MYASTFFYCKLIWTLNFNSFTGLPCRKATLTYQFLTEGQLDCSFFSCSYSQFGSEHSNAFCISTSVVVSRPAIVELLDSHIFNFINITKLLSKLDVSTYTLARIIWQFPFPDTFLSTFGILKLALSIRWL